MRYDRREIGKLALAALPAAALLERPLAVLGFRPYARCSMTQGVSMYAWKQLATEMTDEEIEYVFNVAEALGNTHVTLELTDDVAQLKRLGRHLAGSNPADRSKESLENACDYRAGI